MEMNEQRKTKQQNKQQNKTEQPSLDCDEGAVDYFSRLYPYTFTNSAAISSKSLFTNTTEKSPLLVQLGFLLYGLGSTEHSSKSNAMAMEIID